MTLLSYPVAHYLARLSDTGTEAVAQLLSPYQLELLIRILTAQIMSLWSLLIYVCGDKKMRIGIVAAVSKASLLLLFIMLITHAHLLTTIIAYDMFMLTLKQCNDHLSQYMASRCKWFY